MHLNRGTEYGIRAALYLSVHKANAPVSLAELADGTGTPPGYLSNILQTLARFGILLAHRGARRGYSLANAPSKVNLLQIVEALEGPMAVHCCETVCTEDCPLSNACLVTEVMRDLQDVVKRRLEKTNLSKLVRRSARLGVPDTH